MTPRLVLVSHPLCPYVQRVAIALAEKGMAFERVQIDLAAKPDWFLRLSPFGKTPVLVVDGRPVFESAVILEYLEEVGPNPMHPIDPLRRAEHRGWIEFASATLSDIAGFYAAPDAAALEARRQSLERRMGRIEDRLAEGPWFDGDGFSLVDAAFAPVFRYFDAFDRIGDPGLPGARPRVAAWRRHLAARPSVRQAVGADYPERLWTFLAARGSELSRRMRADLPVGA